MKPVKRVEIVVDSVELPRVLRLVESCGVSGYTVIGGVTGKGERGERAGDDLTDVFRNSYVLTACPEEQLAALVAAVRPVLERYGGVCLVSDAQWIIH
jgi:nitrogen regulatory protein PII